ncbi:hypothetical protein [Thermodesulfovibrio yellowstonii]|jgi:hypothetical protein|uniref:Uncharacterized protein n=1 Tax=Thermodesulfovibrio yellowstonii (strain ATCC 51303 / DSM 11347 / YP87) TaxID=289376 RepID=B5YIK0_THEYD|nr:hypothetical protein [Thermodesulfovibrio yellowstonii]ACI21371.1 hypothetical protein THEYE_A0311 [Thermodesulfovibrio yellowstonii DSM 11347]
MKKCKNCQKEFYPTYNLKNFCSLKCQKEYRKNYMKTLMQQKRNSVSKIHRYVNTHDNTFESLKGFKKTSKGDFETEYGSHENYQIAKTCCNWETKQKEGYCITLYEPYFLFRKPCRECHILDALKFYDIKKKAEKKTKRETALINIEATFEEVKQ